MQARFWELGGCSGSGARSGRWWCSPKDVPADTRATGAGDVPPPSPASPIDTVPGGRQPLCRFLRSPSPRSRSSPPCTAIRSIAMHCPPPLEGAGGGRASGRAAGVIRRERFPVTRERQARGWFAYSQEKTFPVICRRQGRGEVPPPSPSAPPPRGAIPHRYSVREQTTSLPSV